MKLEIEPFIQKTVTPINTNFLQRVIVFTLSGTCIVDLKSIVLNHTFSNGLKSDLLAKFLCKLIFQR